MFEEEISGGYFPFLTDYPENVDNILSDAVVLFLSRDTSTKGTMSVAELTKFLYANYSKVINAVVFKDKSNGVSDHVISEKLFKSICILMSPE